MTPKIITLQATSPGNWGQAVATRRASNLVLVSASAATPDLPIAAGSLFAQLRIHLFANFMESTLITLVSGMVWRFNQPSWQGRILLSDDMTIIALAAGVGTETISFNLEFIDLNREDSVDQSI